MDGPSHCCDQPGTGGDEPGGDGVLETGATGDPGAVFKRCNANRAKRWHTHAKHDVGGCQFRASHLVECGGWNAVCHLDGCGER